ncbi:MAG: alpha/beta fold hydrolase [Gammaproteobacteria bacterium]|nr:alpha/beta fold hydrolase [Gammaproteobacteria bacterium]NVK86871.1 alpha/beta fold hydrolase [Gammaproteobacteria bacterium]
MFFQPHEKFYDSPSHYAIDYEDISLLTADNEQLHGWRLIPQKPVTHTVIFFHGNAENISTHFRNVVWLLNDGVQVILFDYRGYGRSSGVAELDGALSDIVQSTAYAIDQFAANTPVFVFGQSLGAAMTITALAKQPALTERINGFIFEASFTRYRSIAQYSLGNFWLTWLVQIPLSWTAISKHDPVDHIGFIQAPLLILHSQDDQIIPLAHAKDLHRAAPNSLLWITRGQHINSARNPDYRAQIREFLGL